MTDTNGTYGGTAGATGFTGTQDPAAIERDIRRTQEEMSRTVNRIGDRLTPRNVIDALLDKAESGNFDARGALDMARRNPVALALIAGGTIWLISDSDARMPKMPSMPAMPKRSSKQAHSEPWLQGYIAHMDRVEMRENEDPVSFQRRRDIARSNYLMIERGHEEEESSFRKRLDEATEMLRHKAHDIRDAGARAGRATASGGRNLMGRTREFAGDARDTLGRTSTEAMHQGSRLYDSNPLVGGLIAAAAGAIAGALLPATRMEHENLHGIGEKARDMAGQQKDKLVGMAREKKDELLGQVEQQARPPHEQQPDPMTAHPMGQSSLTQQGMNGGNGHGLPN